MSINERVVHEDLGPDYNFKSIPVSTEAQIKLTYGREKDFERVQVILVATEIQLQNSVIRQAY